MQKSELMISIYLAANANNHNVKLVVLIDVWHLPFTEYLLLFSKAAVQLANNFPTEIKLLFNHHYTLWRDIIENNTNNKQLYATFSIVTSLVCFVRARSFSHLFLSRALSLVFMFHILGGRDMQIVSCHTQFYV